MGPFKKKCLILAVLETDGRTHATAALGRIVIDLSEFASIDGQELRTFAVACNKSIHAAVGEPQLTVTIKCVCWWEGSHRVCSALLGFGVGICTKRCGAVLISVQRGKAADFCC